jgi:regulation of enolase protein 1 (concanavalin A-like superfamily)
VATGPTPSPTAAPSLAPVEAPTPPPRELRWGKLVDPGKLCSLGFEQGDTVATLELPGEPFLLSTELGQMNAPRLLQPVTGDFEMRVRVLGTDKPGGKPTTAEFPPFHGAGILVWQGPDNYIRLEISSDVVQEKVRGVVRDKLRHYTNFEYRAGGKLVSTRGEVFVDGSTYLALQRRGKRILAAFGPDGRNWFEFPALSVQMADELQVGLDAINSASKPLTARFTDFSITPGTGKNDPTNPGPTPEP